MLILRNSDHMAFESILTFMICLFFSSSPLDSLVTMFSHRFLLIMCLSGLALGNCDINISLSSPVAKAGLSNSCLVPLTLVCILGSICLLNAASKLWHLSKIQCI